MILTCPACATQYRLKDGAIPPEGRTVRCASCKHKWHQDGETRLSDAAPGGDAGASAADAVPVGQWPVTDQAALDGAVGGPPQPDVGHAEAPLAEIPAAAAHEAMIAETPEPSIDQAARDGSADYVDAYAPTAGEADAGPEEEWGQPNDAYPPEQGFAAIGAMHDGDGEPHRGGRLGWIVGLILIVVAAAAAFYFLAPPELKARAGIAEAGESPLQLMLTTSDRQKLASGNELLAISGRVINATDREQAVPPIQAELRDPTDNRLVYKWTIAPPARSLAPGATAPFNSAEVDVPKGGESLSLRFAS